MTQPIIKIDNLTKSYKQKLAIDHLNIQVNQGEIYGMVGPNGAGKSTTIECILGTKKKDAGTIEVLGMDPIVDRKKVFQEVGVQFQSSFYPDRIKVYEMCELISSLYPNTQSWEEMLTKFNLGDKKNQMVASLSGGEQQKLSVILALPHKPKVVFLDELTTGLDPSARRVVWKFLKSLKQLGLTIFLTSHYMDEVHFLCDRMSIIDKGQIIITDTPDEVVRKSGKTNLEDAYLEFIEEEQRDEITMGTI